MGSVSGLRKNAILGLMLAVAGVPSLSYGAVHLAFATDQAFYNTSVGGTVTAYIKLVETRDSVGDTSLLVFGNGLFGFDYQVSRTAGTSTLTSAAVTSGLWASPPISTFSPTSPFPAGTSGFTLGVTTNDDPFSVPSGPTGTAVSSLVREITLGSVTLNATSNSTFSVADAASLGDNTITWGVWSPDISGQVPLDTLIAPGTINVVVPEPTFLSLFGVAGLILGRRRVA